MSRQQFPGPPRFSLWLFLFVAVLAFWLGGRLANRPLRDPAAEPRLVAARGDLAADERTTIDIFRTASPSVVYITSIELRRSLFSLNVYEIPQGTGSGFVWDRQGRIVTNYHVIGEANRVEVTLADQSTWEGELVGVAPDKDLAVLQIQAPAERLQPIPMGDSDVLQVGQKVYAIGNPFGLDHTLTAGIVSALGREIEAVTGRTIQGVIQTDAAINPGNSGGPLLDSAGRLIGVNTAIYSPSGTSAGIGFAVPAAEVNRVVPELIRYGRLVRPGLGVVIANEQIVRRLGLHGVLLIEVLPRSAAARAGLRGTTRRRGELVLGDLVVGVNGSPVATYDELRNELERHEVGETVRLDVVRDGGGLSVEIVLEAVE